MPKQPSAKHFLSLLATLSFSAAVLAVAPIRYHVDPASEKSFRAAVEEAWHHEFVRKIHQSRWLPRSSFFPVTWVVSTPSAARRRKAVAQQLRAADVEYEIIDAIDWRHGLSARDLEDFVSLRMQKALLEDDHTGQLQAEIAAALSHLRLLQRAVNQSQEWTLQLEDDVLLAADFSDQLLASARMLPADWDILYLSGCWIDSGQENVGHETLRPVRWALCSWGFVYRLTAAVKILDHLATTKLDSPFDLQVALLISQGVLNAYITEPHLVSQAEGPSLIRNATVRHP